MRALLSWISRLAGSVGRHRPDEDLDEELRFHLEMQAGVERARGRSPDEAARFAMYRLGGLEPTKEAYRDQRGLPWLDTLWQDLRYAGRMLSKDVGFTGVALVTLALGIGATTAIFSLLNGVLLAPLPYPEPGRLVRVYESSPQFPTFPVRKYSLLFYRHDNRTLEGIAGFTREDLQLSLEDRPERLRGLQVSSNYFTVLGAAPAKGRGFTWAEERENADVAVISDAVWQARFHADPTVIGRQVRFSGRLFTVVGIMPRGFEHVGGSYRSFPQGQTVDVWWPLPLDHTLADSERNSHYVNAVARLKPGVTAAQAQSDLAGLSARNRLGDDSVWDVRTVPLLQDVVGPSTDGIRLLMMSAALVMVITCANVSSVLLARATARRKERAVRFALGAARARLARQSLTESFVLAIPGAMGGVLVALAGVGILRAVLPKDFPRIQNIHVDWTVLAFSASIACLSAALFGLLPAWHEATDDARPALHDGGVRAGASRRTTRLRNLLVIGEIALASALLVTAGLLGRSFVKLRQANAGFNPSGALTATVSLAGPRYKDETRAAGFFEALTGGLRALPGVTAAGGGSDLPWTGYDENTGFELIGRATPGDASARYHVATPGYFTALGMPLLDGRLIDTRDAKNAPNVVVINETFAKTYFPSRNATGQQIQIWGKPRTIVGVVGDVKDTPADSVAVSAFWYPYSQMPFPTLTLVVRTDRDPLAITSDIRSLLRSLDPELPLAEVQTLDDIAAAANAQRWFLLAMIGLFTAAAIVLALIGSYGVLSWTVRQRSRELGIRVALGARRQQVLSLVVRQGVQLGVAGLIVGLVSALGSAQTLQALLYGVSARDGLTFAAAGVVMLALSAAAALVPALTATRTNPMEALRLE
jgi:predicted permease